MPKKQRFSAINVSLPQSQRAWVEQRVRNGGFGTVSAYIGELIRKDRRDSVREELEQSLLSALRADSSGNSVAEPAPLYGSERGQDGSSIAETYELYRIGVEMMRQNLVRQHPELSHQQIDALLDGWLGEHQPADFERSDPQRLLELINAKR